MNIKQAKQEIVNAVHAYLAKDETGEYVIPVERQRPLLLIGPPPNSGATDAARSSSLECR